jgi:hypothetical protein
VVELVETQPRPVVGHLPLFQEALSEGTIGWAHARRMLDLTENLPVEVLPAFERDVLPAAKRFTATQFGRVAVKVRERHHPISLDDRCPSRTKTGGCWWTRMRTGWRG